ARNAVQVPAGAERDGAPAPRAPPGARPARPLNDLVGHRLPAADPALPREGRRAARGVRRAWDRLASPPGGVRARSWTPGRAPARRRRDALRPVPRRPGPSRPARGTRVRAD